MSRLHLLAFSLALFCHACACRPDKLDDVRPPDPEVCNGLDDDLDGYTDEGLGDVVCGEGACAQTVYACTDGKPTVCTVPPPVPEVCNGLDDDCDGEVDEDASEEVCDGLDNDCDGDIDEGLMPLACGIGQCANVSPSCVDGAPVACEPLPPTAELCNGLDDDCDGTVDEDLLTNTSGDLRITNDPAASDQVYIGKSNNGFGLVWADERATPDAGQIYFAALTPSGTRPPVGNPGDVRVSHTNGDAQHPTITWDGTAWGLVFSNNVGAKADLHFQRVRPNGTLDGAARQLTDTARYSDWPDMVWTGEYFALVYQDDRNGSFNEDLYFQRLTSAGVTLGEMRLTTDPGRQRYPILKWSGEAFGLAWTHSSSGNDAIYFQRLNADGTARGEPVCVTCGVPGANGAWADLAWNDLHREWALVWHDQRDGNREVYFARFDEDGTRLGADVRITEAAGDSIYPSIDWNGFQYGLSWHDSRGVGAKKAIYFAQVSAQGMKNGQELQLSSGAEDSEFTTALWNGSTFAFCWRDKRDGAAGDIYFALVGCAQ